jgi:DNA-binding CsgD family transcriptional regulator
VSQSQELKLADLRATFRLLGEVRELGAEPLVWRAHLVERLGRLARARVAVALENVTPSQVLQASSPAGMVDQGWGDESERQFFARYMTNGGDNAPYLNQMTSLGARLAFFTRSRRQLVGDRAWYGSTHVNEARRGSRVDDFIYSSCTLSLGGAHYLGFHRAWGDRPFPERVVKLVHLVHEELARLWFEAAAAGTLDPFPGLTERQRETLNLLLRGASEKEVARQIEVSPNTVHRFVVALHRHFRVSSRGELLATCHRILQRHALLPRLCMEAQPFATMCKCKARPNGSSQSS